MLFLWLALIAFCFWRGYRALKQHLQKTLPRSAAEVDVDMYGRTRDIIQESVDIAFKTKSRATAESRIGVAEKLLGELQLANVMTPLDELHLETITHFKTVLDQRFEKSRRKAQKN